jgi:cytochrome c-type biogenesis protein CcmH
MGFSPFFWAPALVLLAATMAFLLLPLLRQRAGSEAPASRSAVTAVFRDHKRQIEDDYAARTITADERDAALAELTQRFGQELGNDAPDLPAAIGKSRWIAAIVLAALVPIVAGSLYWSLGNPAAMSTSPHGAGQAMDDPRMAAAVEALAAKLKANPEDGEAWYMLGRSYRVINRYDAAVLAYAEAAKRLPPNAAVYTDWAEAIAQTQGKSLAGEPTELLNRALAVDGNFPKALALRGSAAMEQNDNATAILLWKKLRAQLQPDDPNLPDVDAALARVGATPDATAPAAAPSKPAPAMAAAAPATPSQAMGVAPAGGPGASVEGRVDLDPKLKANAAPGDTVFIFARAPEGSRMPLAVLRLTVADLPKTFALTDAMAMTPAATISKAGKVVIEARVSKSGNVAAQPGDLSGVSSPVAPGAREVRVTIDRVVP